MSSKSDVSTRFRLVGPEQSGILTAIHRACFSNYWNPDAFSDFFNVEGTYAILAEAESAPQAMVVWRVQYEQSDIITIAVLPGSRRLGLARDLMTQAIASARTEGAKSMFLDVEEGNTAALQLYSSFGFTQINRRKLYYRQKDGSFTDALVMTSKLA